MYELERYMRCKDCSRLQGRPYKRKPSGRALADKNIDQWFGLDMVARGAEAMKPPMFSIPATGSEAQRYLRRGMQFRDAAMPLPNYVNGETNWPRIALLTHAIELALKALVIHADEHGLHRAPPKRPANHDLEGWHRLAVEFGLPFDAALADSIAVLNDLHQPHFARYPNYKITPVPDLSSIPDQVVEHLISVCLPVVFPR